MSVAKWNEESDKGCTAFFLVLYSTSSFLNAVVAELADAQDSGSCARQGVEVQVLSTAYRV